MSFVPVTFGGKNVTPKNDGGLYQAHYGNGILWGCGMSIYGTPATGLTIATGEIIECGRVIAVDGATNIDLTSTGITNGYAEIILDINLSATPPVSTTVVTSANTSFPALTREDLNDNGNRYQMELAVVQISAGRPSSIYKTVRHSSLELQDNLYIYGNNQRRMIEFVDQNAVVGGMRFNSVTGYTEAGSFNSDTTLKAGIRGSSEAEVFADNDDIRFRPKGAGDSTNEMYLDTSGQIHGGHQVLTSDKTTSTNLTAGTWSSAMCTVTLTPGVWQLTGTANIKCLGTSSTNWAMINIGHSTASNTGRSSAILSGSTSVYLGLNASLIVEVTASTYTMDLYAEAEANTSVSSAYLRAVQIG